MWFSAENFHPVLKTISNAIPLTQSITALRGVLLEGKTLADVSSAIFYNLGFAFVVILISSFLFKWTEE